jgi:predicted AlkP superfamily phosphohydrolase/phosphomutase
LKVLVIGFDGASPILIEKWIKELPTFDMFRKEGSSGLIVPPIPAQTPVAWTTFMTGKNPGKHGIFSFATREIGTYERKIANPEMVKAKTLWHMLSDDGKRVGVINVPMCGAENVRGFLVPGFLSGKEGFVYPSNTQSQIKRNFGTDKVAGDVEIDVLERVHTDPSLFFERINQITDEMAEICLHLLREEEWEFFMTVFLGTDRIQHFFWKYVDSAHPKFQEDVWGEYVKKFYIKIDKIVSRFLERVNEDTLIMVLSDHGFCPVSKEMVVNNYLEELGFLTTTELGKIDLERSKAVSYGYGDVWLNVKGREPKGIVDPKSEYEGVRTEICNKLKRIEIDGEKPIRDVKKREQLYQGPCLNNAPDLTTIFNIGWQAARRPEIMDRNETKRYVNDNPRWSGGHDGTHDPLDVPGIINVLGPGVQAAKELRVHLWDAAPTILHLMGVPIPSDMDGKPFL